MRWRRDVTGELGEPVEHGVPVVPARWRLPALVAVCALCVAIFVFAVVYGLNH